MLSILPLPETADFTHAIKSPYVIDGRGQVVFWQKCWVKVYVKGQYSPIEQYDEGDGCAILPNDTEIVFGGVDGCVKEES